MVTNVEVSWCVLVVVVVVVMVVVMMVVFGDICGDCIFVDRFFTGDLESWWRSCGV